jgi:hypothetical protein
LATWLRRKRKSSPETRWNQEKPQWLSAFYKFVKVSRRGRQQEGVNVVVVVPESFIGPGFKEQDMVLFLQESKEWMQCTPLGAWGLSVSAWFRDNDWFTWKQEIPLTNDLLLLQKPHVFQEVFKYHCRCYQVKRPHIRNTFS